MRGFNSTFRSFKELVVTCLTTQRLTPFVSAHTVQHAGRSVSTSTLHDLLIKISRKGAIFVYEEMLNRFVAIFISCDFILFHSRPRITRTRVYEIARSAYLLTFTFHNWTTFIIGIMHDIHMNCINKTALTSPHFHVLKQSELLRRVPNDSVN